VVYQKHQHVKETNSKYPAVDLFIAFPTSGALAFAISLSASIPLFMLRVLKLWQSGIPELKLFI
jgi:hypothetical protein